jgi:hypothetical protein
MIIINKFEDFYGVEKLLNDKVNTNELPADKQSGIIG